MSRNKKPHRRHRNRKRIRPSCSSSTNKQKQVFEFDAWQENMPQWLKNAQAAIESGRIQEAAELLDEPTVERAMKREKNGPGRVFVMYELAMLLRRIGQVPRAENLYKEILKSNPHAAVYNELAGLCEPQGRLTEAIQYLYEAMEKTPDEPKIWSNLGINLVRLGETEKGIALLRKAIEKMPDNSLTYSNLLFDMHYMPDVDASVIFEESKRCAQINAPENLAKTTHNNAPVPDRRLRIGYISPDFRMHSVAYFFEPLLDGHDRKAMEVYGYGNVEIPDRITERLKAKFDHYRSIRNLDDETVAGIIEDDRIDILIDLAGHSKGSRIYTMAYKPAPIQVTWLGYPDTTGMSQIDYRLTDSIADPAEAQKFYTEELVFLPDGFLCYGPRENVPPVAPLPAMEKGYITFGSFNSSSKINPVVIELWCRILKSNEGSSLLLKFKSGGDHEVRAMYLERFEKFGISRDRIATCGWLNPPGHLELYNQVDIALDTYPYNGTTTTCQALLMGVPVISLVGKHHMSRVGLSILTRLGLEFFAASTPEEYVAKACALAAKPEALAKIRASMRARMAASPLCNRDKFVSNVEQAYRKMWHRWCKSQGVDVSSRRLEKDVQLSGIDASVCSSN